MPELVFHHATVSGRKTAELLIRLHQFGREAVLVTHARYQRDGKGVVSSRVGLEREADHVVGGGAPVPVDELLAGDARFIIVDEGQFFSASEVEALWELSLHKDVYVYGLKTDFRTRSFDGSRRLFELADRLVAIENHCARCHAHSANFNMKMRGGRATVSEEEPQIEEGHEELYAPVCKSCYVNATRMQ
jgi:thymidine kinase